MSSKLLIRNASALGAGLLSCVLLAPAANAHCDSYDGPIIPEAQMALHKGDVQPLLKWVEPEHETELKAAFERARSVSSDATEEARELAELWFLETFVRLHREGEGAPYTGLKPAGSMPEFYLQADAALAEGSVAELADEIGNTIAQEIRDRFDVAYELAQTADDSVEDGRKFVAAYVNYFHFIEALHHVLEADHHQHH